MNEQINTAIKRARGYWFVDGFTEIASGGLFIILAVFLLASLAKPQESFPAWFLSATGEIILVKLIGFLAAVLLLWWLKDHFTYPRTGFVRGKQVTTSQVLTILRNAFLFLLLPIFGLLAASLLITSTGGVLASMPVWFPVGLGILWSVLFIVAGEWMGLRRFRLMGVLTLLAGTGIGIWEFALGLPVIPADVQPGISQPAVLESLNRTLDGLSLLVLASGVILLVSGLLAFLRYRNENPQPYKEET